MRIKTFFPISFKSSALRQNNYNITKTKEEKIIIENKNISKMSLYNDYNILAPKNTSISNTPISQPFSSEYIPQEGQIMGDNGRVFNRHTTHYARVDLNWKDFGAFLEARFKDTPKVNTYIYGCSYGEEAYSLLTLLSLRTKNSPKFFPIKAKDITPELIEGNAQRQSEGVILSLEDIFKLRKGIGLTAEQMIPMLSATKDNKIKIKDNLAKQVEFESANILLDLDSIDSKNPSIVMARNMWPYISPERYEEFAQNLYDKLAKGSVVIIGRFDNIGERGLENTDSFPYYLKKAGFKPTREVLELTPSIDDKPVVFVKD